MNEYRVMLNFGQQSSLVEVVAESVEQAVSYAVKEYGAVSGHHYPRESTLLSDYEAVFVKPTKLSDDDLRTTFDDQFIALRALGRGRWDETRSMINGDWQDADYMASLVKLASVRARFEAKRQ